MTTVEEVKQEANVTVLHNQPYDESVEAEVSEDKAEDEKSETVIQNLKQSLDLSPTKITVPRPPSRPAPSARVGALGKGELDLSHSQDEDEEDEEDEDDDEEDQGIQVEGAYDPADYEHLPASAELKELFQFITRYTPQTIELEHKIKPFIPDFIPAVGDIDAFIKIPRPDSQPDKLGLHVLDEPCAKQSDPTVLDLQLRAISKETTVKSTFLKNAPPPTWKSILFNRYIYKAVKSLQDADKHSKEIDSWITSIGNLHRSKPPPTVHYARNMPDIDSLMQEWPPEFEELLKEVGLPSADLDCTLEEYVKIITSILDIPVYKSKIQSLHVLFSLYLEFKNSQHFKTLAMENKLDNSLMSGGYSETRGNSANNHLQL